MRGHSYRTAAARRTALIDVGKFFLVAGIAVWLLSAGVPGLGYPWQWYRVPRFLFSMQGGVWTAGPLLQGLLVTLEISALSLICTLALGLTTALFRLSASFTARALARGYLELIRNTPLLIQIFFVYFVLVAGPGYRRLRLGGPGAQPLRGGLCRGDPPGGNRFPPAGTVGSSPQPGAECLRHLPVRDPPPGRPPRPAAA